MKELCILMVWIIALILFLADCTSSTEPEPVCEDVKTFDSICYIPLPKNTSGRKQCGFTNMDSCDWFAKSDREGYVTGTCQPQYKYVRECN